MLYYDFNTFSLHNINNISQITNLLNPQQLTTLIQFLTYTNKTQPYYFITKNHYKNLNKNYNKLLKSNTSHNLIIKYISNSLKHSKNQHILLKILIQLHFNNKTLNQLINIFTSSSEEALAA